MGQFSAVDFADSCCESCSVGSTSSCLDQAERIFAREPARLWLAVEQGGGEWLVHNAQSILGLMRHPVDHFGVIFTILLESEWPNYEATFMRLTFQMPAAEVVSSICKQLPRSGG